MRERGRGGEYISASLSPSIPCSLSPRPFLYFAFPQKFDLNQVVQSICVFKRKKTVLRKWRGSKTKFNCAYANQERVATRMHCNFSPDYRFVSTRSGRNSSLYFTMSLNSSKSRL